MSSGYFDWETAYGQYHNRFPGYKKQPVIGITGNFGEKGCELAEGYFESILKAGATPVIILLLRTGMRWPMCWSM